ncbi:MAG: peptide deformylase, partial [Myxococcota bacterium]|nr:peptide deformylase [Myxococcota bacterium]
MAIRKVARLGHPVLRKGAQVVPEEAIAGPEVQRLIDDMLDTVVEYEGAGLAAPQIHVGLRIVVLQLSEERGMEVWINPELTPVSEELHCSIEGCLSVPGLRGVVCRPAGVRVAGLDRTGERFELVLHGFPAVVAQHECDH